MKEGGEKERREGAEGGGGRRGRRKGDERGGGREMKGGGEGATLL